MLEAGKGCSSTGNTFYLILLWNYWTILKIEVYFKNKHGVADLTLRRQWTSLGQSNLLEQVSRGRLTLALTSNHAHGTATFEYPALLCAHSTQLISLVCWPGKWALISSKLYSPPNSSSRALCSQEQQLRQPSHRCGCLLGKIIIRKSVRAGGGQGAEELRIFHKAIPLQCPNPMGEAHHCSEIQGEKINT